MRSYFAHARECARASLKSLPPCRPARSRRPRKPGPALAGLMHAHVFLVRPLPIRSASSPLSAYIRADEKLTIGPYGSGG